VRMPQAKAARRSSQAESQSGGKGRGIKNWLSGRDNFIRGSLTLDLGNGLLWPNHPGKRDKCSRCPFAKAIESMEGQAKRPAHRPLRKVGSQPRLRFEGRRAIAEQVFAVQTPRERIATSNRERRARALVMHRDRGGDDPACCSQVVMVVPLTPDPSARDCLPRFLRPDWGRAISALVGEELRRAFGTGAGGDRPPSSGPRPRHRVNKLTANGRG